MVLIIGILAAIAIPKFANTKDKAYITAMKSDLRNLVTAQESYYSDNSLQYTTSLASTLYGTSTGVTVTVTAAGASGWGATAAHGASTVTCAIFAGDVSYLVAPAVNEGEPACQ